LLLKLYSLLINKYFYFGCISLNIACKCYISKSKFVLSECNDLYCIASDSFYSFYVTWNQTVSSFLGDTRYFWLSSTNLKLYIINYEYNYIGNSLFAITWLFIQMTGSQTTCGRFFSYQNGCSKKNWAVIHLLSLKLSLNSINTLK
jgi:hypothetical protein